MTTYPAETLDQDDDDGTMPENVATLASAVVGHRIIKAEQGTIPADSRPRYYWGSGEALTLTLDTGARVRLLATDDCCAYTALESFLLHPERVNHVITGVGTTDGYTKWHIYADMGDVLELTVGWSAGNYGYGFEIAVEDAPPDPAEAAP